ncbi:hypothetical protein [Burkholderia contaminans]|uniref:hypothetical protein n=1 Tax=Burkholderia contaminans TaxID=488447 RepID=UPI001454B420|nr:hypothetical protein [Burkholderia contaminans]VWD15501.1 hypothetical protein BCO18442_03508 [Burkholderia contaminans]
MSKVDELKRLFKLRAIGALSEDQYRKALAELFSDKAEKPKKSYSWRPWHWVIAAALLMMWAAIGYMTEPDRIDEPTTLDTYHAGISIPTTTGVVL